MENEGNFFSSDVYLTTLAQIYFPGKKYSLEIFRVDGQYYRLLVINGEKVITTFPFLDFFQHLENTPRIGAKKISYLPRVVHAVEPYSGDRNSLLNIDEPKETLAPFCNLSQFDDWNTYQEFLRKRKHDLITDTRRRLLKLMREKGNPRFTFGHNDSKLIDICIDWKSHHYDHMGGTAMFFDPRHKQMLIALQRKGVVITSSLSVGNRPIAVDIGIAEKDIYHGWISAYDRSYAPFAPGRLLLHHLLQESLRRRFKRYDFLLGGESYKWYYTTHYRVIGPIGRTSIHDWLHLLGMRLMHWGRTHNPQPYYFLKKKIVRLLKMQ